MSSVQTGNAYVELADHLQRSWCERDDRSFDPYDGLGASRAPARLRRTRAGRLALVHLHRRAPVNLRPLFGVVPTKSPYTVAHFASACLRIAELTGSSETLERGRDRLVWLRAVQGAGGWAYPFDVQTRTFHYLRTTPNVVCTAFAANALLDAAEALGDDAALAAAARAAQFALDTRATRRGHRYFTYLPGRDALIHNGNLLAARFVVRAGLLTGDDGMVACGVDALSPTLAAVRVDGSLPYGQGDRLAWVDGHHTGFAVESLCDIARLCPSAAVGEIVAALATFYRQRLFREDGWARPRPDATFPLDTLAAAQGIQTFAKLGGAELAFARRVADFTIDGVMTPDEVVYQRHRFHVKRIAYARWVDAPLCLALAELGIRVQVEGGS